MMMDDLDGRLRYTPLIWVLLQVKRIKSFLIKMFNMVLELNKIFNIIN